MEIINSWDKLTIGKYQEVLALQGIDKDRINYNIELATCLSDYKKEELLKLGLTKFKELIDKFDFLLTVPTDTPKRFFNLNGKKFIVCYEYNKINAGQFADVCHFTKDEKLINQNLHLLLASLIKYEGDKMTHAERATFLRDHLTMNIAYAWSVFFCQVMQNSSEIIADYLLKKAEKMLTEAEHSLNTMSGGAGT